MKGLILYAVWAVGCILIAIDLYVHGWGGLGCGIAILLLVIAHPLTEIREE